MAKKNHIQGLNDTMEREFYKELLYDLEIKGFLEKNECLWCSVKDICEYKSYDVVDCTYKHQLLNKYKNLIGH